MVNLIDLIDLILSSSTLEYSNKILSSLEAIDLLRTFLRLKSLASRPHCIKRNAWDLLLCFLMRLVSDGSELHPLTLSSVYLMEVSPGYPKAGGFNSGSYKGLK